MSDEKSKLSQDDLKPVADGKPAAKDLSPEELSKVVAGAKGESLDKDHTD